MTARDATASVAGEQLLLLGERAVYWERTRTLFVADPHFGKAAAFRAADRRHACRDFLAPIASRLAHDARANH